MHFLIQCWLWLCQEPRPASARSQLTRLWWPDSRLCSPVCCSTTRGSCNGPRTGWRWAWARDSKVSGATQQAQHQTIPSLQHAPQPAQTDSWTQPLLVSHLTTFLLFPLAPPFSHVWVRLFPCPPELCLHCFPNPAALPFLLLVGSLKKGNGKPGDQRKPRDLSVKELQTDRHQESCCCRQR